MILFVFKSNQFEAVSAALNDLENIGQFVVQFKNSYGTYDVACRYDAKENAIFVRTLGEDWYTPVILKNNDPGKDEAFKWLTDEHGLWKE